MARENIEAGSGLAQALAGFSKAVGDTRVQNAKNLSDGLNSMLTTMYAYNQERQNRIQQDKDNAHRQKLFGLEKDEFAFNKEQAALEMV